jgi:hypothetical protein
MIGLRLFAASAFLALSPIASQADEVLLTVTGLDKTHSFDREALFAMEQVTFSTETIWTDGVQQFTGVSLHAFLDSLGVADGMIKATAINDYSVDVPVSDAVEGGPIIAFARNGEEMSIRDKGPLWLVYPYDSTPDYRSEVIYSRSIWQLDRIEIVK